jgi:hypothetical protein
MTFLIRTQSNGQHIVWAANYVALCAFARRVGYVLTSVREVK